MVGIAQVTLNELNSRFENTNELDKKFPFRLIDPYYIEEAFLLLGFQNVEVRLLILPETRVYRDFSINYYGGYSTMTEGMGRSSFPEWTKIRNLNFQPNTVFRLNDENIWFLRNYPKSRKQLKSDDPITLSIIKYFRAIKTKNLNDAILDSVIGLETLLANRYTGISFQFRTNLALLIGQSYSDRVLIDKLGRILYFLRSNIVHGGGVGNEFEANISKLGPRNKVKNIFLFTLQIVLFRFLKIDDNHMSFYSRDSIIEELEKARLGESMEIQSNSYYQRFYKDFLNSLENLDL